MAMPRAFPDLQRVNAMTQGSIKQAIESGRADAVDVVLRASPESARALVSRDG